MMLDKIQKLSAVNLFTFVFPKGRMGGKEWEMIRIYSELLGKNCWSNVACVITHVDFKPDDFLTLEQYNGYLAEVENNFKRSFLNKFQANLKLVIAVDLTKPKKTGVRDEIHQRALGSKLEALYDTLTTSVFYTQ
jgi:hypothetical protein